jgi:hypothetical protein
MCWSGVPAVQRLCLADQPADGDDRVGEVEERVDLVGRIQTIEQVVSLTDAAGLPTGSDSSTPRPELAHSLTSHREQLMELDLDTSLLLDRANEVQEAERESPWPDIEADHEAGYPDGDVASVRQVFGAITLSV